MKNRALSYYNKYGQKKPILANMMMESVDRVRDAGRAKADPKDPNRKKIKIATTRALHYATTAYVLLENS